MTDLDTRETHGGIQEQEVTADPAVKLNSADFQRGGFDTADARQVVGILNSLPVDLVELSGGSYEAPAMQGNARDGRTLAREAYFLEFAREIAGTARVPLMVTGGIRRREVVEQVLASGVAMAGIATGLALDPDLPRKWRDGQDPRTELRPVTWKHKPLAALATMAMVKFQLRRIGRGQAPKPAVSPIRALVIDRFIASRRTRQYRRWMASRAASAPLLLRAGHGEPAIELRLATTTARPKETAGS